MISALEAEPLQIGVMGIALPTWSARSSIATDGSLQIGQFTILMARRGVLQPGQAVSSRVGTHLCPAAQDIVEQDTICGESLKTNSEAIGVGLAAEGAGILVAVTNYYYTTLSYWLSRGLRVDKEVFSFLIILGFWGVLA